MAFQRALVAVLLMTLAQTLVGLVAAAESPRMLGTWKIEITFTNGESRSLRFDVQPGGKGSFMSLDPRTKVEGPGTASEAKWAEGVANSVRFSGPFTFLLGNVGRDQGTLIFTGKITGGNSITGQVDFAPLVGERPSKHGTFHAARVAGG